MATHFINHSLGLISIDLLESGRYWFLLVWRNPLGTVLLDSSLVVHVALVLTALYRRRHLRLPRWEIVRLVMGLLMPVFLIPHIFGTQVLNATYGVNDSYAYVVSDMWVAHPDSVILQSLLLVLAWAHGSMGVHYWLRFRTWYPRLAPWLRSAALLLPVFGLLGFYHAGRSFGALWGDPNWHARTFPAGVEQQNDVVLGWANITVAIFVLLVAGGFCGALGSCISAAAQGRGAPDISAGAPSGHSSRYHRAGGQPLGGHSPCVDLRRARALHHLPLTRSRRPGAASGAIRL